MAYVIPTPAQLKTKFPAFAAVDDAVVQLWITEATASVDVSWMEADYANAIMWLACHLMVKAGLGKGAEAEANANGLAGFSLVRSGQLTLQRAATSQSGAGGAPEPWDGTWYGEQFYYLLRRNKPAILVAAEPAKVGILGGWFPPYFNGWPY